MHHALRAPAASLADAQNGWEAWCLSREAAVTSPQGNLALVETRWLPEGESPDLDAARTGLPGSVTVTTVRRTDLATGQPQHALRFWDAESLAIRHFERIDRYPFNPEWVVEAAFVPVSEERRIPFEHIRDAGATRDLPVPGDIRFTLDGVDYALHAFDDEGTLLLVFGDPTNGTDTYGAGRFLFVPHEAGSDTVVLDFNRAFVPPCGFSAQYNCPMPPRQNRLHLPVEAGEKQPVLRDGHSVH
ncbi:DUF1684 domain-containing protein [Peterkaempfera griseoplana]|uniref:DUF1684 domain-containing protein n=1 Tax=Peterkaempfera griseoplana TaxID=66896 RepID=UPI0006E34902|nr:DUF1684 domain-containing protein [Peterkaempfera griseoplana]